MKKKVSKSKTGVSDEYKEFQKKVLQLYDIFSDDINRKKALEDEYKVKMTKNEYNYLESQRDHTISNNDPRKIVCYPQKNNVDPSWVKEREIQEKRAIYEQKQRE